ncbi:S-adenosyl-L-methionine-dependent methyltransferase, partial [Glonium stellatum]
DQYDRQWNSLWVDNFLPWDKFCASPALVDLLDDPDKSKFKSGHLKKKALVPGCGRGYDVYAFASHGYDTVGVEISETAAEEAKKWVSEQLDTNKKSVGKELGKVNIAVGDFFEDDWMSNLGVETGGAFELVYDYAFLVAMNPLSRDKWAKRMAEIITPKTGLTPCHQSLEYPLFRPPETGGPPHGIKSEDYDRLLGQDFNLLMRYKPERTHEVGKDSDMVSVWCRK